MNDEEFKQRLSAVAEWRIPKVKLDGVERRKLRGRPSQQELDQELEDPEFTELNPTLNIELVKLKCQPVDCKDCGQHCPNGRESESKLFFNYRLHWRQRCTTCGLNQNPYTGKWDLTNKDASGVWNLYLRNKSLNRFTKDREENQDR